MVRPATIAVLLAVLVAMADASTYRTTVTTTEIREGNPSQTEKCRQQMSSQQLRQCQQYLMYGQRGLLMMRGGGNPEMMQQCCEQLGKVEKECRCDAIKQVVRQQEGKLEGEQMQEMVRRAQNLPEMCRMEPQRCEISGRVWY